MIEPRYQPLVGFSLAYTPGTNGTLTAEALLAPLTSEADFVKYKGKLKGKIVLYEAPRFLGAPPGGGSVQSLDTRSGRYSDADLEQLAKAAEPGTQPRSPAEYLRLREFRNKLNQFLLDEGVAAAVTSGRNGDSGTVFGSQGGSQDPKNPTPPPMMVVTAEHYNRMARLIDKKIPVKLQLEIRNKITEDSLDSLNVVAELPGGKKKNEIVMLGGHLDSWQGGTGATDNASGAAVVMEAVRILKALNLKLDRTVRVALWSAEEQGLLGSRAYVKEHFADREKMVPKPEHAKLAAYFNYDNGSGKIRGIYLQGNDMVRPVFEEWLKPFHDLGATTVTIRNTGGTDHQSFDGVGLPGFQFIQDPLDYMTRTHHSNMDVVDNTRTADLMQSAAIMAAFVYQAANREEMLPRKPLPKPQTGPGF
jgi:hypothetical protein